MGKIVSDLPSTQSLQGSQGIGYSYAEARDIPTGAVIDLLKCVGARRLVAGTLQRNKQNRMTFRPVGSHKTGWLSSPLEVINSGR